MAGSETSLLLRRLKIEKLQGVAPTELFFCDEFNVLLGKNATGKTTLLRMIEAIVSDNFREVSERFSEFAIEYDLERVEHGTVMQAVTFKLTVDKQPELQDDRSEPKPRENLPVRGSLRVTADGYLETFSTRGPSILDAEGRDLELLASVLLRPQTLLASVEESRTSDDEQAGEPRWGWFPINHFGRFDEALDAYELIVRGEIDVTIPDTGRFPRVNSRMRNRSISAAARDLVRKKPEAALQPYLQLDGESIEPLDRAAKLFGFASSQAMLLGTGSKSVAGGKRTAFGGLTIVFHSASGFEFQNMLSFGQRRMLAFLFYWCETRGTPAVMDELVNGLHHEWVDLSITMLRDRQCFFASQNPLLLDELTFGSIDDVAKMFVVCTREKQRGSMKWAPLTRAQATSLWKSHRAGVQHVHEILRDEELW